ncbi:hypothetical protein [Methylobacter svalbardensis]|uniref:hypothetical protein n=1 Tax=Methylobacter svalbardensis TaxID=3080016 RepID=UPI0030EB4E7D
MNMKNYRLFLLGFVTASFVLLTGFQQPGVNNAVLTEKPAASVNVKKVQLNGKQSSVKSKHKKAIIKPSVLSANDDAELQKMLDLTIPFKISEDVWLKNEQNKMSQRESANLFATGRQKKPGSLDLEGQMLMSQEPEVDKQKSLDGAGIVITLER